MCGRFVLQTPAETLQRLFDFAAPPPSWEPARTDRPRYNIAPTQPILVVRGAPDGRRGAWARWGITAAKGRLAINARSESVFGRPAFRDAVRTRRVIVPADGFLEWAADPTGRRRPRWLRPPDGRPVAMAGVLAPVQTPGGAVLGCAVLTTAANDEVSKVHDRMPVVLAPAAWSAWLDPRVVDPEILAELLAPAPDGSFEVVPVSSRVNKVDHDDPACLGPPELDPSASERSFGVTSAGRGPAQIPVHPAPAPDRPRRKRSRPVDPRQLGFDF